MIIYVFEIERWYTNAKASPKKVLRKSEREKKREREKLSKRDGAGMFLKVKGSTQIQKQKREK
jgi:hypothetical protein